MDSPRSNGPIPNGIEIGEPRPAESEEVKQAKAQILGCLEQSESSGLFFHYAIDENPCNPGLYLRDYGWLGLPFSARDADALFENEKYGPRGDVVANGQWSIPSSDLEFRNEGWRASSQQLMRKGLRECGITAECSLSFDRLLVYRPGCIQSGRLPVQLQRPEEAFGRLVITLPSDHKGFMIRLSREEAGEKVDISNLGSFSSVSMTWIDGVDYQMQSGENGNGISLSLIYDIEWHGSSPKPTSNSVLDSVIRLRTSLQTWTSGCEAGIFPNILGWQMTKHYPIGFQPSNLNVEDLKHYNLLQQACVDGGCDLYLADVERSLAGMSEAGEEACSYGRSEWPVTTLESDRTRVHLADSSGVKIGIAQGLNEISFLSEGIYDITRIADQEKYEEDRWGDDGDFMDITHIYRDSALLLIPRDYQPRLFVEYLWKYSVSSDRVKWVSDAFNEWRLHTTQDSGNHWSKLCTLILEKIEKERIGESSISRRHTHSPRATEDETRAVVDTALLIEHTTTTDILKRALPMSITAPNGEILDDDINRMAKTAAHVSFESIRKTVEGILKLSDSLSKYADALCGFYISYLRSLPDRRQDIPGSRSMQWLFDGSLPCTAAEEKIRLWASGCLGEAAAQVSPDEPGAKETIDSFLMVASGSCKEVMLQACQAFIQKPYLTVLQTLRLYKFFSSLTTKRRIYTI